MHAAELGQSAPGTTVRKRGLHSPRAPRPPHGDCLKARLGQAAGRVHTASSLLGSCPRGGSMFRQRNSEPCLCRHSLHPETPTPSLQVPPGPPAWLVSASSQSLRLFQPVGRPASFPLSLVFPPGPLSGSHHGLASSAHPHSQPHHPSLLLCHPGPHRPSLFCHWLLHIF